MYHMYVRHKIIVVHVIPGAVRSNVSVFLISRNLALTKTEQGTDKASKQTQCTVFLRDFFPQAHQKEWCQLCLIIYHIFVLFPHNLDQIPFLPPHLPPT